MADPNIDPLAKWNLAARCLSGVGTLTVAVIAIWGDFIRSKVVPPKLKLSIHNARGTVTKFNNGSRVIFYHLKVANSRHWAVARNCRVFLKEIHRRGPDQQFRRVPLAVPVPFVWAPAESTPSAVNISTEQVLDLGYLLEPAGAGVNGFVPRLQLVLNDFQGLVEAGECVRFSMQIEADGYTAQEYQVYEVAWSGSWSDDLDAMAQNLTIREVTQ